MDLYRMSKELMTTDCDLAGAWRPSGILEAMQDAAGVHGEKLGFGREALLKQGLIWVISRLEVEMDAYPHFGDSVTIETFPTANRRWFFPRWYVFKNSAGEEIGRAGSLWVLLDLKARRMAPPDAVASLIPDNSALSVPMNLPSTCMEVGQVKKENLYIPQYADLDLNMHVNNVKYLDLCCNALGIEMMQRHCLRRFAVNYTQEIRAGQQIRTVLGMDGDLFSFSGLEGDRRHFDISGELMKR